MSLPSPLPLLVCLAVAGCTPPAAPHAERADTARGALASPRTWLATGDSTADTAHALISAGRPWAAYRLVAPALRDSGRRSPAVVLAAARAAATWGGWAHVEALLADGGWPGGSERGAAHELLARAALGRDRDSVAVRHATLAAELATDQVQRGERQLLLARALDRLDDRAGAARAYLAAARALPSAADWLILRAAAVTPDSAERAQWYARVVNPVARARVASTEASARERTEDFAGAARAYAAIGRRGDAVRAAALHAMRTGGSRDSLRAALVGAVRSHAGTDAARVAAELLDLWFAPLPAPDELLVARSLSRSGPLGRAAQAFQRAAAASLLTADDRYRYGRTLAGLNRDRAAAAQFARVTTGRYAAAAAYQRGRALVAAGDVAGARSALRSTLARFPNDTSAGLALFLLADLATDEGRDQAARDAYREGARRFPAASRTARARFLAALIAYTAGAYRDAAAEWDALATHDPRGTEAVAARYWSGRARERMGDRAGAGDRWRTVRASEPLSYYAFAATRRLGDRWTPFNGEESSTDGPDLHPVLARALRLEELGLDSEARLEFAHFEKLARGRDLPSTLDAARQLVAADRPYRAIPLAATAAARVDTADRATAYRTLYPAPLLDVIVRESRRHGIDPALFAALVRQESWYNPRATSGAGARGFAQVLPSVGRAVARSLEFPYWDPALLYDPEASVTLGTAHLAASLRRSADEARALAAYNAGQSRVRRWERKRGTDDVEVFIERIPFVETRDYVRIVLRNRAVYRALYPALRPA